MPRFFVRCKAMEKAMKGVSDTKHKGQGDMHHNQQSGGRSLPRSCDIDQCKAIERCE